MSQFDELKSIMVDNQLTIAVAESLTCGLIQAKIGDISGASKFMEGGLTAYNLKQKVKFLQVDESHAASVNCVSKRVASEMATNVTDIFGTNIGLGTTGYAEPYPPENVNIPYGFFAIYLDLPKDEPILIKDKIVANENMDRNSTRSYFAEEVLNRLIVELKKILRKEIQ